MKHKLWTLLLFIFLFSCKNESLIKGQWKYQEGYHAGDWLDFEENVLVRNDTIYRGANAYARFIKINVGYLGVPAELHLADLSTGEEGVYVGK